MTDINNMYWKEEIENRIEDIANGGDPYYIDNYTKLSNNKTLYELAVSECLSKLWSDNHLWKVINETIDNNIDRFIYHHKDKLGIED